MKFGVREICNVVFRAKAETKIGNQIFKKGQPVLYIDTAKTSTMEGAATTVYAQGGRGNTRLLAWEGEKTLTFTVEDAMISPIGFSVLSGAGLIKQDKAETQVHVHATSTLDFKKVGEQYKSKFISSGDCYVAKVPDTICETAPIFISGVDEDGSIVGNLFDGQIVSIKPEIKEENVVVYKAGKYLVVPKKVNDEDAGYMTKDTTAFVDYYVKTAGNAVSEIQIDAEKFGGYYYVEADTLFKRQNDGVDMPANITFPNVKIQSNFTFSMASTGDPSTFTFTMDAFPGYTYFDNTKKVLCVIQVVEQADALDTPDEHSVMLDKETSPIAFGKDKDGKDIDEDSVVAKG